jgi:ABC-type amino acid transport substrate-binding protein
MKFPETNQPTIKKRRLEMNKFKVMALLLVLSLFAAGGVALAATLDEVKARGVLVAGVNGQVFGFGMPDEKGVWKGLDVDTAKAIAAAVFGVPTGEVRLLQQSAPASPSVQRNRRAVPEYHRHPYQGNHKRPEFRSRQLL